MTEQLIQVRSLIDEFVAGAAEMENLVTALEIIDGLIGEEQHDAGEVQADSVTDVA